MNGHPYKPDNLTFAHLVLRYMVAKNMNFEELAERSKYSRTHVQSIAHGVTHCSVDAAEALADAFKLTKNQRERFLYTHNQSRVNQKETVKLQKPENPGQMPFYRLEGYPIHVPVKEPSWWEKAMNRLFRR